MKSIEGITKSTFFIPSGEEKGIYTDKNPFFTPSKEDNYPDDSSFGFCIGDYSLITNRWEKDDKGRDVLYTTEYIV